MSVCQLFNWFDWFSPQMVVCLLNCGADIDAVSLTKDSPLHIALKFDRRACVNALLQYGADARLANHDGETPLHIAIPVSKISLYL